MSVELGNSSLILPSIKDTDLKHGDTELLSTLCGMAASLGVSEIECLLLAGASKFFRIVCPLIEVKILFDIIVVEMVCSHEGD